MGQYYTVANMDMKEVLCIEGKFIGGKLLEIAETASDSFAILNQIAVRGRETLCSLSETMPI